MAIIKNLTIDKNVTYERTITLYGNNNQPFDLSDYTANSEIKKSHPAANVEAIFTCTIDTPESDGKIIIYLDYTQLSNTKSGKYQWDLVLTSFSNEKIKAVEGSVDIIDTITRI